MLSGSILPGITRDSVLSLARSWGVTVSERKISIDEVMDAHRAGTLEEVFGSGTAAVISPVGEIKYDEKIIPIGKGVVGPMAKRFFNAITDIQYGRAEAPANWIEKL
jgi:branched-chain amino acid aminotransferase